MSVRPTVMILALGLATSGGCGSKGMVFESVNPSTGRINGGEEVRIRGGGFEKMEIEVRIDGHRATNVGVQDDETIVLTTPEGRESEAGHPVDISILTSEGRGIVLRHAFTYQPGPGQRGTGGPNDDLRRRL